MKRGLSHLIFVISCLGTVLVVTLWVRSSSREYGVEYFTDSGAGLAVITGPGTLVLQYRDDAELALCFSNQTMGHRFGNLWCYSVRYGSLQEGHSTLQGRAIPAETAYEGVTARKLGFGYGIGHYAADEFHGLPVMRECLLAVPMWFVLGLLAIVPARQIAALSRRRKDRSPLCRHCGYDLRASPIRCPECGRNADISHEGLLQ